MDQLPSQRELSPQHVAAWIEALKDAGELAPKSIRNVHCVLSTMVQQARFEGLVDDNAARALPRGILPAAKVWGAPWYSREELGVFLGHPSVPEDGRILSALMGLGGLRMGEAAGRRWKDIDTTAAMIDAYTWMGWGALCEAVAVLQVERLEAMPDDAAPHSPELGAGAAGGVDRLAGLRVTK